MQVLKELILGFKQRWPWLVVGIVAVVLVWRFWDGWMAGGIALLAFFGIVACALWRDFCGWRTPLRLSMVALTLGVFWLILFGLLLGGETYDQRWKEVRKPVETARAELVATQKVQDRKVENAVRILAKGRDEYSKATAEVQATRTLDTEEDAVGAAKEARSEAVQEKEKALADQEAKLVYNLLRVVQSLRGLNVSQKLYLILAVSLPLVFFIFGAGPLSQHGSAPAAPSAARSEEG